MLRHYERAHELLKQGFGIVCVDEKTPIQARERTRTPDPAVPGYLVHISSRHRRQGALNLFGGLSVVSGQVYGQCHLRKRFVDFQAFLLAVIIPEALRPGVHTLARIGCPRLASFPEVGLWDFPREFSY